MPVQIEIYKKVVCANLSLSLNCEYKIQAQFAPSEQKLRSPASTAEKGFMFGSGHSSTALKYNKDV